jgi:hypothetical protein
VKGREEKEERELEPMAKLLEQLSEVEGDKRDKEVKTLQIHSKYQAFYCQADKTLM